MGRICLFIINFIFIFGLNAHAQPTDEELAQELGGLLQWVQGAVGEQKFSDIRALALAQLEAGNLSGFDPLVGDTSCELRAMMGVLFRNVAQLNEQQRDLVGLIYMLGVALEAPRNTDGFNTHPRGGDNNLDQLFRALDFRLTGQARKTLISKLQRAVALGSVLFARQQAGLLSGPTAVALQDLFLQQCRFDSFRRPVVSCLGICYLLLERARSNGFPIIMRLRLAGDTTGPSLGTITVAYVLGPNNRFVPVPPTAILGNPTVVIVEAFTTYFNNPEMIPPTATLVEAFIGAFNFERALILDSVFHPQFAGDIKNTPLIETTGNAIAQEWAAIWRAYTPVHLGLQDGRVTRNDQRIIRVDHVYPDTLANARRYNPFALAAQPDQVVLLTNALYFPARLPATTTQLFAAALALAHAIRDLSRIGAPK